MAAGAEHRPLQGADQMVAVPDRHEHPAHAPQRDGDAVDVRAVDRAATRALAFVATASPLAFVRPARREHTGQAPGPCTRRTFFAISICWPFVAWWAYRAYLPPPKPSHVCEWNCRPP